MTPTVHLTNHAVARYQERVRPGLDLAAAKRELTRLLAEHGQESERPDWMADRADQPDLWVTIGPDVWLPCLVKQHGRIVAVSVVCNGNISEATRRKRNAERKRHTKGQKSHLTRYERETFGRRAA